jgi:uridylate kinase
MNLLIKFSGEFFEAKDSLTHEGAQFIEQLPSKGYIVVGGGNRVRGKNASAYSRTACDNLGVLSTIMNGFILKEYLLKRGFKVKIFSHFLSFGEFYTPPLAIEAFENDHWVIFASGLGQVGYISTDLNAVIKALEVQCHGVIKVTKTAGLFDKDPKIAGAKLIHEIDHHQVLSNRLEIMDLAAIEIAQENKLPIAVIGIEDFAQFMNGEKIGSMIGKDWR